MATALSSLVNQALRIRLAVRPRRAEFDERNLSPLNKARIATLQALAVATPAPIPLTPEDKAKRRPPPAEYIGRLRSIPLVCETIAGIGAAASDFSELYEIPMIVRRMQFSTTATLIDTMEVLLVVGTRLTALEAEVKAMIPVWPDGLEFPDLGRVVINAAGAPVSIPMAVPITTIPFRIGLWVQNITAGPFRMQAIVTLQEGDADPTAVTRVIVHQYPRAPHIPAIPAPPRFTGPPRPPIPRGVTISVFFGRERVLSRDIAWPSLDDNLKRSFLNYQLRGEYPPTMQPIW